MNGKPVTVRLEPGHLPADADDHGRFALEVTAHVAIMLAAERFRHEHFHVLADGMLGVVTEHLLGRRVEPQDDTINVGDDDGVDRRFQQCLQRLSRVWSQAVAHV